jgi:hypothetical protein
MSLVNELTVTAGTVAPPADGELEPFDDPLLLLLHAAAVSKTRLTPTTPRIDLPWLNCMAPALLLSFSLLSTSS